MIDERRAGKYRLLHNVLGTRMISPMISLHCGVRLDGDLSTSEITRVETPQRLKAASKPWGSVVRDTATGLVRDEFGS